MVGWQASLVDFGVVEGVFAVLLGVVGDDGLREDQPLEDALGLGEGESRTEGPAAAEFPFALFAEGVGGQQVDGVAAVVVRRVGLYLVAALDVSQRVGGPEVEALQRALKSMPVA